MGVEDRLTTAGGGDDGIVIAPSRVSVGGDFVPATGRDLRPNRVVTVTTDAAGADTFTLTFALDPDPDGTYHGTVDSDGKFTTAAINDDDVEATIQAAIRAALPGTDLTVVSGDGPGPFDIIFDRKFSGRRFPRVTGTGSGCTVTVENAALEDQSPDTGIGALGESYEVSPTDSILKPTIGTITVTGGTDEVQTFAESAGTDGGTVSFQYKGRPTGGADFNSTAAELQALVDSAFSAFGAPDADSSPTVAISAGKAVATIDLDDIGAADTYHLTYDGTETSGTYAGVVAGLNTYAATDTTDIQAMVDELTLGSDAEGSVVTRTDANTYVVTHSRPGTAFASTFTVTTATGFTPLGSGGYVDGGKITTAAGDPSYTFTFENGVLDGRPVGGAFAVFNDALTDGGVSEPGALTVTTPGVKGSISTAYTENGAGDTVLVAAVNDTTKESKGFASDAATPVVITGLVPGAYHLVMRTVEDGRVSKADSKAFVMTSS